MNETVTISAFAWRLPRYRFALGWLHDCIYFETGVGQVPYMERWVIRVGWLTLRYHRIYRGDVRLHDHPFWFITFPLTSYHEEVWDKFVGRPTRVHRVRRYRFHFRDAKYIHRILEQGRVLHTLVIAGPRDRENRWGFYDSKGHYTPHQKDCKRVGDGGPS